MIADLVFAIYMLAAGFMLGRAFTCWESAVEMGRATTDMTPEEGERE